MKWTVEFYRTPSGRRPAEEWLSRQPKEVQARFAHVAPAGQGIWEMRAVGSDRRMLYSVAQGHRFVVLHGLAKGGREIPDHDLRTAKARKRDWRARSAAR